MKLITVVKETWLTRNPNPNAWIMTLFMALVLLVTSVSVFTEQYNLQNWLPVSAQDIFQKKEYWRLWTALFVHGDLGHLLSNSFLFFPLAYLLSSYFSLLLFPLLAILVGGFINLIVITTLPETTSLVGISGVVYWMASAWLTLYVLIDRRHSLKRRFAAAVMLTALLLAPESYKPDVSYLSHLLGYIFGIVSSLIYFAFEKNKFRSAEVVEIQIEEDPNAPVIPLSEIR